MSAYDELSDRQAVLALWYVVNTSLTAHYKLVETFGSAKSALGEPVVSWQGVGVHSSHQKRLGDPQDVLAFLAKIDEQVRQGAYDLLFLGDDDYPDSLTHIYDPPPVLFYRGTVARLKDKQLAIVGSRQPTEYAQSITFDLAQYFAHHGYAVTSGLAGGVDKQAHLGALSVGAGQTVGVLGTGIDVCYPKNHHALYAQIVKDGGCLVSELLPSTPATKHTFPRRNRLVAGLACATIVTEATVQSGSLITARLTAEQGKQVFAIPSRIDNPNAEGCHHLIREGATLIYHPNQVLDELRQNALDFDVLPKTFSRGVSAFDEFYDKNQDKKGDKTDPPPTPEHLSYIMTALGDESCDLDKLVARTQKGAGELLAGLMELEMMGQVVSVGGRFIKA
ncbi:MAG: DNA-processing protein DprA [Moraxella sp.]|nr:DNA-processing protein DprA [Moraxella sp.]